MTRATVSRIVRIVFFVWLVVTALIVVANSVTGRQKHSGDAKTGHYPINRGETNDGE